MEIKDLEKLNYLLNVIKEKTGFEYEEYSKNFLMRRLEVRLRAKNTESYEEYAKLLDKEEQTKLLKEFMIHVTHFFRDISFYEAFRKEVIPEIIKKENKKIKIWSAGTSTGEEPCSIMICFYEELGRNLNGLNIEIIATDYDEETIEKAKIGEYEEIQFKETPEEIKNKYFEKKFNTRLIKEEIKKHIAYKTEDIIRQHHADVDIIICRNTVIYFETQTKTKLYNKFYELLKSEGYLILGKTETINGEARDKFKLFNPRERIYKK